MWCPTVVFSIHPFPVSSFPTKNKFSPTPPIGRASPEFFCFSPSCFFLFFRSKNFPHCFLTWQCDLQKKQRLALWPPESFLTFPLWVPPGHLPPTNRIMHVLCNSAFSIRPSVLLASSTQRHSTVLPNPDCIILVVQAFNLEFCIRHSANKNSPVFLVLLQIPSVDLFQRVHKSSWQFSISTDQLLWAHNL